MYTIQQDRGGADGKNPMPDIPRFYGKPGFLITTPMKQEY
jgi:hypothetical protein